MSRLARLLVVVVLACGFAAAAASAADTPTLSASVGQITFGANVILRGTVPAAAAGQDVDLLSQACGFTAPVTVATVTSAADGSFSFSLEPSLNTTFLVQVAGTASAPAAVTVQPLVQLRRMSARSFQVSVSVGAGEFFTKQALIQRFDKRHKTWKTVGHGTLKRASDIEALIAVSAATVHAAVAPGSKIRAYVPAATLGQCYRPASSAAIKA